MSLGADHCASRASYSHAFNWVLTSACCCPYLVSMVCPRTFMAYSADGDAARVSTSEVHCSHIGYSLPRYSRCGNCFVRNVGRALLTGVRTSAVCLLGNRCVSGNEGCTAAHR